MDRHRSRRSLLSGLLSISVIACGGPAPSRLANRAAGSRPQPSEPAVRVELVGQTNALAAPLLRPIAVAVDRVGRRAVIDAGRNALVIFDVAGQVTAYRTGPGQTEPPFRFAGARPCDETGGAYACLPDVGGAVAIDQAGCVYLADWGNHRLVVLDAAGRGWQQWGRAGERVGELSLPAGVAVTVDGDIVVSDTGNGRLQQFDRHGQVRRIWAPPNTGADARFAPGAIVLTADGRALVLDPVAGRLERVDGSGRWLGGWRLAAFGEGEVRFQAGLAVDQVGRVLVAGSDDLIHQVDGGGREVLRFDRSWQGEGRLRRPAGVASGADGSIHVVDQGQPAVLTYRLVHVGQRSSRPEGAMRSRR